MAKELYDEPTTVAAEDGKVLLDGPDGVDVALTPDAAIVTGERLIEQGVEAAGQARLAKIDHRPK